jgi:hypothetical protein
MTLKELYSLFNEETKLNASYDIEEYLDWLETKLIDYSTAVDEVMRWKQSAPFNVIGTQTRAILSNWITKWQKKLNQRN